MGKYGDLGSLKYILAQLFACVIVQIAFCHFLSFYFLNALLSVNDNYVLGPSQSHINPCLAAWAK